MNGPEDAAPPVVEIVRGAASPAEVAALVIALAAVGRCARPPSSGPGVGPDHGGDGWAARWRGLRTSLRPGPDAWRLSGRG